VVDNKLRVKDIAAELGIGNKDVMQACRDLDIPVRSHMSTIEDDEADQIRAHVKKGAKATEVVLKEVQPGMVVRRRRKAVRPGSQPVAEDSADEPEDDEAQDMEPGDEAQADAPDAPEAPDEAAQAAESTPAQPRPARKARVVRETPKARIISPAELRGSEPAPAPEAEEPVAQTPVDAQPADAQPQAPEAPAAPEAPVTAEAPEAGATEPQAPGQDAPAPEAETPVTEAEAGPESAAEGPEAPEAEGADAEGEPRKKKKKKIIITPKVRVISRPDPNMAPPAAAVAEEQPQERQRPVLRLRGQGAPGAEPGRPAGGYSGPGRPGGFNAPANTPGGEAPAGDSGDASSKKRRKKDRRVVDFSYKEDVPKGFDRGKKGKKTRRDRRGFEIPEPQGTQPIKAAKRKVRIEDAIRLADLAKSMGVKAQALIKVLFAQFGLMATINQSLDYDTAALVAAEFGYEVEKVGFSEEEYLAPKDEDSPETLAPRAPVVTIMGHVDHGKTSLLDAIRKSKIASGEAGGITQHIGAYDVTTPRGKIVFLDTPGHAAFTAMRARGAQVTDIVILVVAADDGVMEQTREAISHSKAAGVPIIVAVNKMDKPEANPDRVMRELAEQGLSSEEWGGETIFVNVSAKAGTNLDTLLEMVLLQAEVLELKANPDKPAQGHIVEARLDKGRGPVATVLITAGTLRQGDTFICGTQNGKVRAMFNDQGRKLKEAGPATPVEVQGFDGIPQAGDLFVCVEDEKVARRIAGNRQLKERERTLARESRVTLESFMASKPGAEAMNLNLVLKADVQGSLEAIVDALKKLSTDAVKVNVIHGGAGAITESDILLAAASEAIVIGFNVRPTAKIKEVADHENVDVRFYDIIYKLVSDVKDAMTGMLAPVISEKYLGQAEVRETFSIPKVGTIAGCYVVDGELRRNAKIRLLRDGVVVYTGALSSLKRFKDDAKEVRRGYECGAALDKFNDVKVGDVIEAFEEVETAATLD
jgi:translation initiation factor IF-2